MTAIKEQIQESVTVKNALLGDASILKAIETIIGEMAGCFKKGNKILIAGNGGSAADSQHFAAEIVGRYRRERKGYPAIALTTDTSVLTAWSNDYDFSNVFERQVEAFGKKGDMFFGISTSGNAKNVMKAVEKAKEMGLRTVCLLGKKGGALRGAADIEIIVPSDNTPRIQESHIMLIHIMCEEVDPTLR